MDALAWTDGSEPASVYPDGIPGAIAQQLGVAGIRCARASIDDPEQGLGEERLAACGVLLWFGHSRHADVTPETTARVVRHVIDRGMGLVALHSAHHSRPFAQLLGTACDIGGWREDGRPEVLHVVEPKHPIARGLPLTFTIPHEEMYAEPFVVPTPEAVVLISSFERGGVFRSGCCWTRGRGRIFYFRPGHETFPVYHDPIVGRVLANACTWARPRSH
jgi:trehalose utilization protein